MRGRSVCCRGVTAAEPEKRPHFLLTAHGWPYMLVPFIPVAIALELAHAGPIVLFVDLGARA